MLFEEIEFMTLSEASVQMEELLRAGLVPMLHGSPAMGKSAVAAMVAKKFRLKLIDLRLTQLDPADLNGLPDLAGKRATFKTFDMFPLEDDPIPEGYTGWLLFLDEINSADDDRQAAAYKLILDHMVGQQKLHPKVLKACAGNLETDGAIVNGLGSAMVSRLVHLAVKPNLKEFLQYVVPEIDFSPRLAGFLEFSPSSFYTFDPANPGNQFSAPRTLEFASKYMKSVQKGPDDWSILESLPRQKTMMGIIGKGITPSLVSYLKYFEHLPTWDEIVSDPENTEVPAGSPGVMFAICSLIAENINMDNIEKTLVYIDRMQPDFQTVALRMAARANKTLRQNRRIGSWMAQNLDNLV